MEFKKEKEYLVCLDSDGTVMDTMKSKHEMALAPCFIEAFQIKEHKVEILHEWFTVNLYKMTRGLNRFIALDSMLKYITKFGYEYEGYDEYHNWVVSTKSLSIPSIKEEIIKNPDNKCLLLAHEWGEMVNERISQMDEAKPFENSKKSIEALSKSCDLLGVSSANQTALVREWTDCDIIKYFKLACGQAYGTKETILEEALKKGYKKENVLMVGDSSGDLIAAKHWGLKYFPMIPDHENESWDELINEALPKLLNNTFTEDYQAYLISKLEKALS